MMFAKVIKRFRPLLPGLLLLAAVIATPLTAQDDGPLEITDIRLCNYGGNNFVVTWRTNQPTTENYVMLGLAPDAMTTIRQDTLTPPSLIHYVQIPNNDLLIDSVYYYKVVSDDLEGAANSVLGYDSVATRLLTRPPSGGAILEGSVIDSVTRDALPNVIVRSYYRWTYTITGGGTAVDSTMWRANLTNQNGEFVLGLANYRRYNGSNAPYFAGNTWMVIEILSQFTGAIRRDSVLLPFTANAVGQYYTLDPYEVKDDRVGSVNGYIRATGPVLSNGASASVVTVTALDRDNNPLPNVDIELVVGHERGVRIFQPQLPTDRNGRTWGLVYSTVPETKTIRAINVTSPDSLYHTMLDSSATVRFVSPSTADIAEDTVAPFIYFTTVHEHTEDIAGPYNIFARAVDNFWVDLELIYGTQSGIYGDTVDMDNPDTDSAHIFLGEIPGQNYYTTVSYYVLATDSAGLMASKPDSIHSDQGVGPYIFEVVEDTQTLEPKFAITLTTDAITTTNAVLPVKIDTWIHCEEEISSAVVKYRKLVIGGNNFDVSWTDIQMDRFGAHYWAEIPRQSAGSRIEYFIQVTDATGWWERDRRNAPNSSASYSYEVLSAGALGQVSFADTTDQLGASGNNPSRASAVADFDEDGYLDVVVANYNDLNRIYFYNQALGFEDLTSTSLGTQGRNNTTHVAVADFNGDDYLDIIFSNEGEQNRLLINNTRGRFDDMTLELVDGSDRPHMPSDSWGTMCIVPADYDGDGDMDLYVANGGLDGERNRLLFNDGNGVFYDSSATKIHNEPQRQSVWAIAADVDNDEDPDVVVINRAGQHYWLDNNGRGVMVFKALSTGSNPNARGGDMADLDGDGDLDLVVGQSELTQNELYINNGNGTFTRDQSSRLPAESDETYAVKMFDANADGYPDIYYLNRSQHNRLLINNQQGYFTEPPADLMPTWSSNSRHAAVADFNNDNRVDLYVTEEYLANTMLFSRNYDPNGADQPSTFNLLAPGDGDTVNTTTINFVWNASTPADSTEELRYDFLLSLDSLFSSNSLVTQQENLTDTTISATITNDNTRYWWKVYVRGNTGYPVPSTETRSFMLMTTHQGQGPEFFVLINRNPVFSGHVTAYIVASEPLLTNPTVHFNNQEVAAVAVNGSDIYRAHYTTRSSFLLTISGRNLSGAQGDYSRTYSSTLASSLASSKAATADHKAWIELPATASGTRILASTNTPVTSGKLKNALTGLAAVAGGDYTGMAEVESYTFTVTEGGMVKGARVYIDGAGVENPDKMTICRMDKDGWTTLATVYDPENGQFNAPAEQEGTYALLAFGPGSSRLPKAGQFMLGQNSPNPFNPSTFINFVVPGDAPVEGFSLKVYNLRGQVVNTLLQGTVQPGAHSVQWNGKADNGRALSSGIYFYRMQAPGISIMRKMVLLR